MKFLKKLLNFWRTDEQQQFVQKINSSYSSLSVSENGAVSVDVAEVRADPSFKEHLARARNLVN